ncbi:MAG TPA: molybdenum cofactor guanylyltransferase [Blastocatellia bacterium]|nr:molybdenum cofactor guanylyltransferase [Blastocatellia bacterium]
MEVHAFVTAGGLSSRMATDKAWLQFGDRMMIQRIAAELLRVTPSVAIIANDIKYEALGFPVFRDSRLGVGPLEAIRTALEHSSTNWTILVGCDLPFVTAELIEFMMDRCKGHEALVPVGADGFPEPLCALYECNIRDRVARLIEDGGRKVSLLLDNVRTHFIAFDEISHLKNSSRFFINVNTREEYQRALAEID